MVGLSDKGMDAQLTESYLERIHSAYKRIGSFSPTAILLVQHNGHSVGEYTSSGLANGEWR